MVPISETCLTLIVLFLTKATCWFNGRKKNKYLFPFALYIYTILPIYLWMSNSENQAQYNLCVLLSITLVSNIFTSIFMYSAPPNETQKRHQFVFLTFSYIIISRTKSILVTAQTYEMSTFLTNEIPP